MDWTSFSEKDNLALCAVRVYVPYRRPNGWVDRTTLGTRIHLDPGSILDKSRSTSRSQRRRREMEAP